MINRTFKNFKLGVLLLGASFLLITCQKDDTPLELENVSETTPSTGNEWLGVDELPSKVIEAISTSPTSHNKQSSSFFNVISTDSVIRTIDPLGI